IWPCMSADYSVNPQNNMKSLTFSVPSSQERPAEQNELDNPLHNTVFCHCCTPFSAPTVNT
ncbi:MAG: hypothetical protein K2L14_05050, partial [Duncaniella sp.]|nr:hypothetical protein [Duncaniella sp.]